MGELIDLDQERERRRRPQPCPLCGGFPSPPETLDDFIACIGLDAWLGSPSDDEAQWTLDPEQDPRVLGIIDDPAW